MTARSLWGDFTAIKIRIRIAALVLAVVLIALVASGHYAVVAYAFVAMVIEDILGTFLGQAQARNKAALAAAMDALSWFAGIVTTLWSLNAINGHDEALKYAVIISVTAANLVGSYMGTKLGAKYIHIPEPPQTRIERLEQRMDAWESTYGHGPADKL